MPPRKEELQPETMDDRSLKSILDARPKKDIHIPEDDNNPGDVVPIGWNGIIYAVPRGKTFKVPDVIANIWQESYEKTQRAKRKMKVSENKDIVVTT